MFLGEELLVDIVGKPHVEQSVLLLDDERFLPGQFLALSTVISLSVSGLRSQHHAKPVADRFIFNLHPLKNRQHLGFNVAFLHPDARMAFGVVTSTAIVNVIVDAAIFPLLLDQLARDRVTAMTAGHELTGISQGRSVIGVTTQKCLHTVPGRPIDQRLVFAGIPFPFEFKFTEISSVFQDVVNRASWELRLRLSPEATFGIDLLDQAVERQVLVSVEMEDAFDVGGWLGINFDDPSAILAGIAVAVWSETNKPAFFDTPGEAFADID